MKYILTDTNMLVETIHKINNDEKLNIDITEKIIENIKDCYNEIPMIFIRIEKSSKSKKRISPYTGKHIVEKYRTEFNMVNKLGNKWTYISKNEYIIAMFLRGYFLNNDKFNALSRYDNNYDVPFYDDLLRI
jgi:hypothetical protein